MLHTIRSASSFSVVSGRQFYSPEDFACDLLSIPRITYVPVSCRLRMPSACAARAHLSCAHPARARAPRAHHSHALVVTHSGQSLMLKPLFPGGFPSASLVCDADGLSFGRGGDLCVWHTRLNDQELREGCSRRDIDRP